MGEGLGPSPEEMGIESSQAPGQKQEKAVQPWLTESPELAQEIAEVENANRDRLQKAREEGGQKGSESNLSFLEAAGNQDLERRKAEIQRAVDLADTLVDRGLHGNQFGWTGETESMGLKYQGQKELRREGQDLLKALRYRTTGTDREGKLIPKTFNIIFGLKSSFL